MPDISNNVYTPQTVRDMDREAIEGLGIPGFTLMTRAGEATFAAATARFPAARRWLIVCGAGNNAGDGYVIARCAMAAGHDVVVHAVIAPERLGSDAQKAWQAFRKAGGEVTAAGQVDFSSAQLIVDALLGTGIDRELTGAFLDVVNSMNAAGAAVVAVDVPSGLHAGSGDVMGAAVRADFTATYVGLKQGLYLGAGPEHTGAVELFDLEIPASALSHFAPTMRRLADTDLARALPPRLATAHKGHFGHVLVVGGNRGMSGAVRLAGEAALRSGAGLVSIATHVDHAAALAAARPELMVRGVDDADVLAPLLERATVIVVGPGLGQDDWARALFAAVLTQSKPLIVDADALNLLAAQPLKRDDWILTPHPGEAARLLECSTAEIQMDRLGACTRLAESRGGVAVLKGRGTLVGQRGALPLLVDRGNPGMASGGMGDVLAGITAAMRAQISDSLMAAGVAALAHAEAGDRAASDAPRGLIASDLLLQLRSVINPGSGNDIAKTGTRIDD